MPEPQARLDMRAALIRSAMELCLIDTREQSRVELAPRSGVEETYDSAHAVIT
jgi:hypothetical protein